MPQNLVVNVTPKELPVGRMPTRVPEDSTGTQLLRLVCQSSAGHAAEGGTGTGGRATRPRPRATTRADRGRPLVGGAPAAELRGRPARVSDGSRAHADHRVHHPGVGDRPDPRPPPLPRGPRGPRGPRRRAESALDPRTVWTGPHATSRRGPPGPLSLTPTPRPRAGTFGVRVRPTGASDRSPRRPDAHGNRRPGGHRGAAAGGDQAAARRPALAGYAIAPYVHWILDRARLKFLSWMRIRV